MEIDFKKNFSFLLIFFFCLPLILPFLRKGFFVTHDGEWAIVRLSAFHFALKDGQIPPRWAGNLFHTFGYPVLNFNYPLPPMIGEFFHLLGFSFVNSVKFVFILSIIFSAVFMYLLIKEFFDKFTAIFGVILYLYYPFRMVDLFVRGSIGESLSFALLPFVYWSLIKLGKAKNKKWLAISALSLSFLILAHNSIAFISLPFVVLFMIFNLIREKKNRRLLFYCFIVSLLIGLALSCFFWLPALYEKKWTILKPEIITKPTDHFPTLSQLIFPSWGYGRSRTTDSLSFQLGPVHLFLFLLSLPLVLFSKKINKTTVFFQLVFLLNFFFLLPISTFFWQRLPLMSFISYPWRFLVPIGFYFSVVGCFIFRLLSKYSSYGLKISAIFLVFLILFFLSRNHRQPLNFINKSDMFYITNQSTTIEGDENTPVWVKRAPKNAPKEKIELEGNYEIEKQKSNLLQFTLNTTKSQKVAVNTIYYPGWQVFVDGERKKINYQQDEMGRLVFEVDKGEHQVKAFFQETPLRLISDIISLISLFLILRIFILSVILEGVPMNIRTTDRI